MAGFNSSNAQRVKGNDIDSDGDGSVNDADTLQGNQPSDLGNTIDDNTIIENSSGDIEVAKPLTRVYGRFNNGNDGWTLNGLSRTTTRSYEGSHSVSANSDSDMTKTVSLTGVDSITIWFYFNSGAYPAYYISVGSNTIESDTEPPVEDQWFSYTVDTSSISGDKELFLRINGDGEEAFIDYVNNEVKNLRLQSGVQ